MKNEYKIGFYGDFTTAENYQIKSENVSRINVLRQYGYDWLFKNVTNILNRFDMNIFNLETPLTNEVESPLTHKKAVLHWADGEIVSKLLNKYNVQAVSLGNNHTLDYGKKGLTDTFSYLKNANISYFGAGLNEKEAKTPYIKTIDMGNRKINLYVFSGYKYREDYDKDFNFYAKNDKEGVCLLTSNTIDAAKIKQIKEQDKDSFIVIFPHFGFDNSKTCDLQKEYAHAFIDAGADCVIGHGPHMMNSIEKYKDKIILYGIGNFIFPTNFRGNVLPFNMVCELKLYSENDEIKSKIYVYPIYMNNQSYKAQTRIINEDEIDEFLSLLIEDSNYTLDMLNVEKLEDLIRVEIK